MTSIIDWKNISESDKVRLVGKKGTQSYRVGKKMVVWSSGDNSQAQKFLNCKVNKKRNCKK